MPSESDAAVLLSYRVNTGSVQQAVQANAKVEASLKGVSAAATGNALRFNSIADAQAALGLSAQQLGISESAVTTELQRQLPIAERLAEAASIRASAEAGTAASLRASAFGGVVGDSGAPTRRGRTLGQNITKAGRDLFNLPDVGGSTTLSRLMILGGAATDKLGLSLGQLTKGLGVTAAAAVPVLLAFEAFNAQLKNSKSLLEGALAAQKNYYQALGELTTEQVNAQIQQLQDARPLLEQQVAETRNAIVSAYGENTLTDPFGSGRLARGIAKTVTPELFTAYDEAQAQLEENIQTETRLAQGREQGAFQANDLAAAEEELRAARQRADEEITQARSTYSDAFVRASEMTTEERNKEIASIERQISSYQTLIDTGLASGDEAQALSDNIDELQNKLAGTQDATSEWADQLERLKGAQEALTERNDQYIDLIEDEIAAREEAFAIQEKILAIEKERDERIAEIAAERDEKLLELTDDAEEKRIEIIEDAAERIAKIERDAARDRLYAIGNRDALAFKLAEDRRDDALDDQQKALDKSLKQVEKNLEKQEKAIEKSYRKQVDNVTDSANKQLNIQRRALYEAEFAIASSVAAQQRHIQSGYALMAGDTALGMEMLRTTVTAGLINIVNDARGVFGSIFGGGGSSFPPLVGGGGGSSQRKNLDGYIDGKVRNQMHGYLRQAQLIP